MDPIEIARLQEAIDRLADSFNAASGRTSGASAQTTSALRSMINSFSGLKTSSDIVEDSFVKLKRRNDAYESAISATIRGFIQLTQNALSSAQSFYSAEGAFSSAANGINLLNNTIQYIIKVNDAYVSHFPGLGKVLETFGNGVSQVINLYNQAAQAQLAAMQNQLDSYKQLSASGATFGGSLAYLQNAVGSLGIPMKQFTKLVGSSAEYLQAMGVGMTTATQDVLRITKTQLMADKSLVMLAGGFDELAQFTAQYQAQQAMLGQMEVGSTKNQTAAVAEYIRNQKLLSEITGKNAQQQAAEQRRRMTDLGFQQAVARATAAGNKDAANNLNLAAGYFEQFGPMVGEAAKQMAIGGRQSLSPELRVVLEQMPGMLDMIEETFKAARQQGPGFDQTMANITDAYRPMIQQQMELVNNTFAGISAQVSGPLKSIADTAALVNIALDTTAKNIGKIVTQGPAGQTAEEKAELARRADALAAMFQDAEKTRLALQAQQDATIAQQFTKMTSLIEAGFTAQKVAIAAQEVILSGGNAVTTMIGNVISALNSLRTPGNQTPAVPSSATVPQPSTTPAAPAGAPTAPISQSSTPNSAADVVAALERNTDRLNELLRVNQDTRDYTERLVHAA